MKRCLLIFALLLLGAFVFADETVLVNLSDNQYLHESIRLSNLARLAFVDGDYEASATFAEEAIRYADYSDEYVLMRLRMVEAANAAAAAEAIATAPAPPPAVASAAQPGTAPGIAPVTGQGQVALPAQYTVRTWDTVRDCLWNIAGYPWVYNDSSRWTVLYDANKSRLPDPDNADLIEPGFVLTIPSLSGETRQGLWAPGVDYPSFF